ncbi:MAG TPA: DNA repair protein RadC [Steroidobacteraceae bacterium]
MSIRDRPEAQEHSPLELIQRLAQDEPAAERHLQRALQSCAQLALPLADLLRHPMSAEPDGTAHPEPCDPLWVRERDELRPATAGEVIAAARRAMTRRVRRGAALDSPHAVRDFLTLKLGTLEHETFAVLLLDARHRLIDYVELFRGTIDGASVHPREVVKLALARNAAALVLAHPHPSGVPEPSQADELITKRLRDALALVDIRVLDHIIVAGGEALSLAERGLL